MPGLSYNELEGKILFLQTLVERQARDICDLQRCVDLILERERLFRCVDALEEVLATKDADR